MEAGAAPRFIDESVNTRGQLPRKTLDCDCRLSNAGSKLPSPRFLSGSLGGESVVQEDEVREQERRERAERSPERGAAGYARVYRYRRGRGAR